MSANEHIEELLSGFLDGELTAEELREFESAMSSDSSLITKLDQLRQLGSDLRSIPKQKLGSDFSSRVLAAARQEALASDSLATRYICDICERPAIPAGARRVSWRVVGAAAGLAASLMFALYLTNWFPTVSGTGEVAENPPAVGSDANSGESQPDGGNSGESNYVRNQKAAQTFGLLPIIEIETSRDAWNTNMVATILRNEGIVWTKPVLASDDVIKVLNETRSISQGLTSSDDEEVALVMVQASGRLIDKAMRRIYERSNDFPHVFLDLAFDMPGMELFEKVVGQQGLATPIASGTVANGALTSVSKFSRASSSKPSARLSSSDFEAMVDAEDEISFVLLVIRKPAK